ncbi:MAG TPA: TolC family protein [Armatimonadota bacterium]
MSIILSLSLAAPLWAQPASVPDTSAAGALGPILASRPVIHQALTIDQAVEIALRESPVVRGSAADVDAAIGRLRAAQAERLPWLSTNAFVSTGNSASVMSTPPPTQPAAIMALPDRRFTDLNLSLMLPLFTGGRLEAMIRQAEALRRASDADLAAQRQTVALMARTAFHDVQARRSLVDVAKARLTENEARLKNDQARFQVQQIPEYYLRRDEAEVAAAQQEVTNAKRDADLSVVQLKTIMGISPASQIDVSGSLADPSAEFLTGLTRQAPSMASGGAASTSDDLSALLRLAERQRPELRGAEERLRGAGHEVRSVRGAYLPQVSVGVMGDWMKMGGDPSQTGTTAALIASFPLYNGGQREARLREADAMRRRSEQDRQEAALQVAQDVSTALLNLRAAEQNVATANAGLTAAEAEYKAAQLRYDVGRSIVAEVLDALASRVHAQSDVVQARYQYNVAQDQLLRAVGGLPAPATR